MSFVQKAYLLNFLALRNPRLADAINPHVPLVSHGVLNMLAATIIKDVSSNIRDPAMQKDLQQHGKYVFNAAIKSMTYENTVWFSGDEVSLNPQPEPPGRQALYGAVLTLVAESLTSPDLKSTADGLKKIGISLMG